MPSVEDGYKGIAGSMENCTKGSQPKIRPVSAYCTDYLFASTVLEISIFMRLYKVWREK